MARAALGWALAIYVAGNLLMTTFAPILHDLNLTVEVVDEATGAPIPGATVGWAAVAHTAAREVGRTGPDGRFEFHEVVQENPAWVWPMLGSFAFAHRVLRIEAPQHRAVEVPLARALPGLPHAEPNGRVRVELGRE